MEKQLIKKHPQETTDASEEVQSTKKSSRNEKDGSSHGCQNSAQLTYDRMFKVMKCNIFCQYHANVKQQDKNTSKPFVTGCRNFQKSALTRHEQSNSHYYFSLELTSTSFTVEKVNNPLKLWKGLKKPSQMAIKGWSHPLICYRKLGALLCLSPPLPPLPPPPLVLMLLPPNSLKLDNSDTVDLGWSLCPGTQRFHFGCKILTSVCLKHLFNLNGTCSL